MWNQMYLRRSVDFDNDILLIKTEPNLTVNKLIFL